MVLYSSTLGKVSYRKRGTGTVLVKKLTEKIERHAAEDLKSIFNTSAKELESEHQETIGGQVAVQRPELVDYGHEYLYIGKNPPEYHSQPLGTVELSGNVPGLEPAAAKETSGGSACSQNIED
eukprot:TRINITY_DN6563_c0_g1_i5.p1 TRINITY_DN6563_c0_g1~~TRINITY_DN6563_c0_g1_i5.p1  ORF type:complete len:123 (-),score=21.71 TRINITY_DN6563_c0_g1_i5:115-483(-)